MLRIERMSPAFKLTRALNFGKTLPLSSDTLARTFTTSSRQGQKSLPATYYRGGTSRAIIFQAKDLPASRSDWLPIFTGILGSPDPNGRQLDGLGGGISSLSKVCIIGPPSHKDADVDYTFAQVGIKNVEVDYSSNCGNMTSAVGPFAVESGLVPVTGDQAAVRIFNTNTQKLIHSTFAVANGETATSGDFALDGVSGTAAPIRLDFIDPAGSRTGNLLPTGNQVDVFDGIDATCIDVANPCIFVTANSLGVSGTLSAEELEANTSLLARLDSIRRQATVAMGLCSTPEDAPLSVPKICMVSVASDHELRSGVNIKADEIDVIVRAISSGQPHRAVPVTVALALAAVAKLNSSAVKDCFAAKTANPNQFTIGHAGGKVGVDATFDENGHCVSASIYRTARRLMEGKVYWK